MGIKNYVMKSSYQWEGDKYGRFLSGYDNRQLEKEKWLKFSRIILNYLK